VRIIGGSWRSRQLRVADAPGLRPTADRARETLFNWLGQDLSGRRCLDLFAGSGALGFEAASRGAAGIVMVESNPAVVRVLRDAKRLLDAQQITVIEQDALKFLCAAHQNPTYDPFDTVFLDPPFQSDLAARALQALPPNLAADALVYVEAPERVVAHAPWELLRQRRYGQVWLNLLRYCGHG
jgi:16S rRNA (guanine(966)-N(2))-methyltransferase RsmD